MEALTDLVMGTGRRIEVTSSMSLHIIILAIIIHEIHVWMHPELVALLKHIWPVTVSKAPIILITPVNLCSFESF